MTTDSLGINNPYLGNQQYWNDPIWQQYYNSQNIADNTSVNSIPNTIFQGQQQTTGATQATGATGVPGTTSAANTTSLKKPAEKKSSSSALFLTAASLFLGGAACIITKGKGNGSWFSKSRWAAGFNAIKKDWFKIKDPIKFGKTEDGRRFMQSDKRAVARVGNNKNNNIKDTNNFVDNNYNIDDKYTIIYRNPNEKNKEVYRIIKDGDNTIIYSDPKNNKEVYRIIKDGNNTITEFTRENAIYRKIEGNGKVEYTLTDGKETVTFSGRHKSNEFDKLNELLKNENDLIAIKKGVDKNGNLLIFKKDKSDKYNFLNGSTNRISLEGDRVTHLKNNDPEFAKALNALDKNKDLNKYFTYERTEVDAGDLNDEKIFDGTDIQSLILDKNKNIVGYRKADNKIVEGWNTESNSEYVKSLNEKNINKLIARIKDDKLIKNAQSLEYKG